MRRRRRVAWRNVAYLAPALVFIALASAYPLVQLVQMSFSQISISTLTDSWWPFVGLRNFTDVITDPGFPGILINTVILVVLSVAWTLLGGLFIALVLERNTKLNLITQGILIFLWALPPLVIAFVWKFILASDGPLPALLELVGIHSERGPVAPLADPGLALVCVAAVISWIGAAFASLIFRAGILGIERSQIEAASVDGANKARIFWHIVLPGLRPALLVQSLLTVIYCFRVFDVPFIMTKGGPGSATTTLPYQAYKQSFGSLDFAHGSATAVIAVVFVGVFASFYMYATRKDS